MNQQLTKTILATATVIAAALWYFAIDISGNYGFLLWVAPLPLLWISYQSSAKISFVSSFVAYLIGRLNWVPFLMQLMPPIAIVIVTVLPAVLFGVYIVLNRWIVLKSESSWSVFAFPVIVTAFEFIVFNNPVDGTAGGLAYTQANYLAVIQIASVTGIWGIVFIASLLPAAIALAWRFRNDKKRQVATISFAAVVLLVVVGYGVFRLNQSNPHTDVAVGITAVPEKLYTDDADPVQAKRQITNTYIEQISALSRQGANYILFPEKIFHVKERKKDSLLSVFQSAAVQLKSTIIGGLAVNKDSSKQNLVEFFSPSGQVQEYQKRFHVKGFEGDYERGNKVGILKDTPFRGGMAICKDMDFPSWLREYANVDLLFVPAFDFVQDGWLHSRMAVLRGVENGYTIVRAGRAGRLTVSDYQGKILAEANCENGEATSLIAQAPVYHIDTLYSTWGDWFGWLCVCSVAVFIALSKFATRRIA
jgi:apolipoprotein N-acyltransferase